MSTLQLVAFLAIGLLVATPASAVLKSCPGAVLDLEWFQKNAETFLFMQYLHQEAVSDPSSPWNELSKSEDYQKRLEAIRQSLTPQVRGASKKKIDQVLLDPLELLCLSFRLKHHDSPNLTPPQVANPLEDCLPLTVQERLEALENRSIGPDVQTGDHSDETPESTPKLARLEVEVRRNRAAILYLRKATFKTPEVRKMSYNGRSMESF